MEDFKPVRVDPADKTRCQAIGQDGEQCPFQGAPDPTRSVGAGGLDQEDMRFLKHCKMHSGATSRAMKKEAKRLYNLTKWKGEVEQMLDPEVGTNLDEELAIQRMMFQAVLNKCDTDVDLLNYAPTLGKMSGEIRETMKDNKKLKSQMGELMDRSAMHRLCEKLVIVVSKHVPPDKLDEVGIDVAGAIAEAVSQRMHGD